MDRKGYKIWLIPAIIIGINCLAFLAVVIAGYNKDRRQKREEYLNSVSEAEASAEKEEGYEETSESPDDTGSEKIRLSELLDEYDENHANREEDSSLEEVPEEEDGRRFVLLLTSSESDLMIRMVGTDGESAAGIPWRALIVTSDGTEYEAEDDDEDGQIYIDSMASGEYEVDVTDGKGYTESSVINIKPDIRYTASSGIRSIIMQESQINAAEEDTALESEEKIEEEVKPEQEVTLPAGTIGIDVSKYNKDIDWEKVKASGIEFAIIRAGYRGSSTGVLVEDPYFKANLAGAKAAGVKIGIYFFTQAITTDEAKEEAQAVATLVNAEDLSLPVFLDVESSGNSNGGRADPLDKDNRTLIVKAFCEEAENLGYKAGIYANKSWMTNKLNMSEFEGFTKWLAQYRAEGPTYNGEYSIWQYTSSGAVDGINGRVDMNIIIDPALGL